MFIMTTVRRATFVGTGSKDVGRWPRDPFLFASARWLAEALVGNVFQMAKHRNLIVTTMSNRLEAITCTVTTTVPSPYGSFGCQPWPSVFDNGRMLTVTRTTHCNGL